MSLTGNTPGNGQMNRIFVILKKKRLTQVFFLPCLGDIYGQTSLFYSQISDKRLQDHWSSGSSFS